MSELVEHEKTVEAPAHVVVPSRHDQAKAARGARLWTWIARLTGLALLAAVLGFGLYLAAANSQARAERAELIAQLDEERAKVDALYEQLRSVGENPVVSPGSESPSTPGPSGPTGPQGVPGDDGRAPTSEEVIAAVNAYCASIGGCRGADGQTIVGPIGPAGTPGTNGETIVGPQGPAGEPGAAGPAGPAGATGATGVGVQSVACVVRDDLSTAFRFTLTDGSAYDVTGACLP